MPAEFEVILDPLVPANLGLTLTIKLFNTDGSVAKTAGPMIESSAQPGFYTLTTPLTGLPLGMYPAVGAYDQNGQLRKYSGPFAWDGADQVAPADVDPSTQVEGYLTLAAAAAIAAVLPGMAAFNAAADPQKAAALELASDRVDSAYVYQGRKYATDGSQDREFPRVAFDSGRQGVRSHIGAYDYNATYVPPTIWDWDSVNNVAIVPARVLRAVVCEANSILTGDRTDRLNARHDGLTAQSIGSASESYDGGRPAAVLCLDADLLVKKYQLKQGRLI